MYQKSYFTLTFFLILLLTGCSATNTTNLTNQQASENADIAFTLNGKKFTTQQYNTYKEARTNIPKSEQEIFGNYIRQQLIFMEAEQSGCSVSEEEVKQDAQTRIDLLEQDPALKEQIRSWAEKHGKSYEEYIASYYQTSRQYLLAKKWAEKMKQEYDETRPIDPTGNFKSYFKKYIDFLQQEAEIHIIDPGLQKELSAH